METDNATGKAEETVEVTVVRDTDGTNPEPAYETGPHLDDPETRAAKRQQMRDHGWTGDEDHLTDDMAAILAEEED